jgi:diguanylate cyclase (GGDEF)-like protein/PAS domain S-box-containing protein
MKRPSVMIVEDERIIALTVQEMLEQHGYRVVATATSAEMALVKAGKTKPDVVLMDIHLAGRMSGTDAARRMWDSMRLPVVFLTAYGQKETVARAQAAGPFGYLLKPIDSHELNAAIRTALTRWTFESSLEQSERRMRMALDACGAGVWECDVDTGTVTIAGRAVSGAAPAAHEPISEAWDLFLARVHPDDRSATEQAVLAALHDHGSVDHVFRSPEANAPARWIEIHGKVIPGRDGSPSRIVGIAMDVTERRRAEQHLRRVATMFDKTAEGAFIMDAAGLIVSINPAFTRLTGYDPAEAVGRDPDELLHARRWSDQFSSMRGLDASDQWQGETHCRRKNGEVFPAWQSISAVRDPDGTVSHYVVTFSDIAVIRKAERRLHYLAHHDPLTGLPNRLMFNHRLDTALSKARRSGSMLGLLFFDLDGFKSINDTWGHSSGDLLLQTVAARLRESIRSADTAARLGGDEFVVLIEGIASPADARRIARKLIASISRPIELAGEHVSVTASLGISIYPGDGADRQALLHAADAAMYSAKAEGRNCYRSYTADMAQAASDRSNLECDLRRSIETGSLELHYQPLVSLSAGRVTGVEALVRLPRPGRDLLMPDRFIPLAEESRLIEDLGAWVIEQACDDLAGWLRRPSGAVRVSVNVSPMQVAGGRLIETVRAALERGNFPPERLELEITEGALKVLSTDAEPLHALKRLGVRLAIDDFGTGYSSLSVLKHLPIDRLKIDRSFVRDAPADPDGIAILQAILGLSRALRLSTTGEGIERESQMYFLRNAGCEEGQGYLLGRPMPLDRLKKLLG